jgi:hypothetical protein
MLVPQSFHEGSSDESSGSSDNSSLLSSDG